MLGFAERALEKSEVGGVSWNCLGITIIKPAWLCAS